jgi:hypothetical protein
MSNSLLFFFLLHSLRLSGDCHNKYSIECGHSLVVFACARGDDLGVRRA